MISDGASGAALSTERAEAVLFEEAARLDARAFDAWLELFTDDAIYWLPMGVEDPAREPSLIFDDRARMEERVFRLMDTAAHAQLPPSRTQHDITNVRVVETTADWARVACHLVVHEVRIGDPSQVGLGDVRSFPGRCEYVLRHGAEGQWLIAEKTVRLLARELPQYNLTFIV
ncbi:aromatic-ring-hydroxylating dioxygenase subunit beta [Egicoccus sp. AB-alg6-2]|uniref:aromatic-ring-hydroxylating dioxygenase subunit beta n=1 Tax=Egicoccus sp. AB-alg6-2 TaxID=3242692 RepID=UPI00359EA5BD